MAGRRTLGAGQRLLERRHELRAVKEDAEDELIETMLLLRHGVVGWWEFSNRKVVHYDDSFRSN